MILEGVEGADQSLVQRIHHTFDPRIDTAFFNIIGCLDEAFDMLLLAALRRLFEQETVDVVDNLVAQATGFAGDGRCTVDNLFDGSTEGFVNRRDYGKGRTHLQQFEVIGLHADGENEQVAFA